MSYNAPRAVTRPVVTPEQVVFGFPLLAIIISHAILKANGALDYLN